MSPQRIATAFRDIRRERDPNLKSQKLASLVSALFRARGIELVVVGGSAIEFYTDGAYQSGDVDLCQIKPSTPIPLRSRQEIMGQLNAKGGPRSWEVAGMFVDLLGLVETESKTGFRKLKAPYGIVMLMNPEELLVERVLVSVYPQPNREAANCARKLIAAALAGGLKINWGEVSRLAKSGPYRIFTECETLVGKVARELKAKNPFDSNR
ncbi:MAG: hypothetical protein ACLPT4_07615 [Verrucomicrobiia bacterium]